MAATELSSTERALVDAISKVPLSPLVPWRPTPKQLAFLAFMGQESLFGGTARSSKSIAALMAALQFACVPGYNAIIFRRERATLMLPGGLIDVSKRWLTGAATWNGEEYRWTFPSTATLSFGYLKDPDDVYRYHSSEFQFILFEEVAEWPTDEQYRYMFSRLTPKVDADGAMARCRCHGWSVADVPLRMRATANPGGAGTEWVRARFILPHRQGVPGIFFPASYRDNPYVDHAAYEAQLANLREIDRRRLLGGDWDISAPGEKFDRAWFDIVSMDAVPFNQLRLVRWWDMAGAKRSGRDSDWTAGALVGMTRQGGERTFWIIDIDRFKMTPGSTRERMRATADRDDALVGRHVPIRVEREPGSQSIAYIEQLRTDTFAGLNFKGIPSRIAKSDRIDVLATEAELGRVKVVEGSWNEAFFDEADAWSGDGRTHDDQLDAVATAMHALALNKVGATGGVADMGDDTTHELGYPSWV